MNTHTFLKSDLCLLTCLFKCIHEGMELEVSVGYVDCYRVGARSELQSS